jgi:hypothetical protein
VELGPGLSDEPPPGSEGRKQHLHLADPQHWGSLFSFSLFTHDCVAMHASNSIIKFADDTTVVGLITNNNETALGVWGLAQRQQNKGDDRGLQETAEGAPSHPHRRNSSGEGEKLSSSAYTSRTN